MRTLLIAVLSILALLLTTLLPGRSDRRDAIGDVEAALPQTPLLHAPQPTVPAPGMMAISG